MRICHNLDAHTADKPQNPIVDHFYPCNSIDTQLICLHGNFALQHLVGAFASKGISLEMDRFVSTFTNRLDAKGRVSVPASFRTVLERQTTGGGPHLYCYPALDAPALDAGGERLAQTIDGLLAGLPDYSDERDELSVALYGDVHLLALDGDGRVILPESLRRHAGLDAQVTFVGLGQKFQIWTPERFEKRRQSAREKVKEHKKLLGVTSQRAGGDGSDEAPSGA